jgi:Tol biopolymer transport system component
MPIQRVSVSSSGAPANASSVGAAISAGGRYVLFTTSADNLVHGDENDDYDVFFHDRWSRVTECISVDPNGSPGNGGSGDVCAVSADGCTIVFQSFASNLVLGDTNSSQDVFVRDRLTGSTVCVSTDPSGNPGNGPSYAPSMSPDGRYVAFISSASNLVLADSNGAADIFVHDRTSGVTERVSVDSAGVQGNGHGLSASVSANGRYVAFVSMASNLVVADTNGAGDVFVRDRQNGSTLRVSVDAAGSQGNGESYSCSISAAGQLVAFSSSATNLVPLDTNVAPDVFVRDLGSGTTERVSVNAQEVEGNSHSLLPSLSGDGRFVAFRSYSSNLVANDANADWDAFVHDRQTGATVRASVTEGGAERRDASCHPTLDATGRYVVFVSRARLVRLDTNDLVDTFVRRLY